MTGVIIAVDFDGTIVEHCYPAVGDPVPYAVYWLQTFLEAGAKLVLWTMRSSGRKDGSDPLADAVEFCKANGIELFGVNENPEQSSWTQSPKAYAHVYIDDAGLGCPLVRKDGARPYVDWPIVGPLVMKMITDKKSLSVNEALARKARELRDKGKLPVWFPGIEARPSFGG